ncbi:MAG: TlpA family protein disulfide reductase [Pirellulales bacterium]|nr:TlpA family protein disulfide reductase [Pirellulales bacterium]
MRYWICMFVLGVSLAGDRAMALMGSESAAEASSTASDDAAVPIDLAARLDEIEKQYQATLVPFPVAPPGETVDPELRKKASAANAAARKERQKALTALAAEASQLDVAKLSAEERAKLAGVYLELGKPEDAVRLARAAISAQADHADAFLVLIRALATSQQVDEAQAALVAAQQAGVEETKLLDVRQSLYLACARAGRWDEAAQHAAVRLAARRAELKEKLLAKPFLQQLDSVLNAYRSGKKPQAALRQLEQEITSAGELLTDETRATVEELLAGLKQRQVALFGEARQFDKAEALFQELMTEARKSLEASPDELEKIRAVGELLSARAKGLSVAAHETAESARQTWLDFLAEQAKKRPNEVELLQDYARGVQWRITQFGEAKNIDAAKGAAEAYRGLVAALPEEVAKHPSVEALGKLIDSAIRRLEAEQKREKLVGQPMPPLEVAAWVNGSPLSNEELKGKVVLLDFWAVWCGPCRATFPHLREWNEKYADRGLAIIGLTKYYQYGWDAEQQTHTSIDDLSPADEQAALVEFARHHQLTHRLAYLPEGSTLSEQYGVTGIPQMVVIDREGIIRLIRVGSGDENAHDIEAKLEELLAAPAAADVSGGN